MSQRPTLSVKNFEQFQHYKDRTPPWIKLYNELLDDYEFGQLPDASKFHLVAIWLLASRYKNEIPHDIAWISKRINASGKVCLNTLISSGFLIENQPLQIPEHNASAPQAKRSLEKEGEAEKEKESVANATETRARKHEFENEFWPAYPHKVGKPKALEAWHRARAKAGAVEIIDGLRRYIASKPPDRSWLNPTTFLNQQRWADEPAPVTNSTGPPRAGNLAEARAKVRTEMGLTE